MSKTFIIPINKILEMTKNRLNDNIINNVEINEKLVSFQEIGQTNSLGTFGCSLAKATVDKDGKITNIEMPTNSEIEESGYVINSIEKIFDGTTTMKIVLTYVTLHFEAKPEIKIDVNNFSLNYSMTVYTKSQDDEYSQENYTGSASYGSASGLLDNPYTVYYDGTFNFSETCIKGNFIFPIKINFSLYNSSSGTTFQNIDCFINTSIDINAREYIETETKRNYRDDDVEKKYSISSNTFNNSNTKREETLAPTVSTSIDINEYNALNIIYYYKNGIDTLSMRICAMDYFDSNNNKVIDNSLGQIPKCGDYFTIDTKNTKSNDNKKYIITSSEFIFNGVPQIKIEAKEIGGV